MFHKQILSFAVLLPYVFVLGKSHNATQIALVTDNVCSDISYAFDYFELDDKQTYTYTLKFASDNRCGEVYEKLKEGYYDLPKDTCIKNNCTAGSEIQTMLSHDTLKQVCMEEAPEYVRYEEQLVDLCERKCHHIECVKNFNNICDNITEVEEVFKLGKSSKMQKFAVIFHKTKGERQCNRTAIKLNKLPSSLTNKNINGTVHSENCIKTEKVMSSTLNLNGIKWVCSKSRVIRVIFEEKYFNENVCQDITRAKHLFFPNDINKPKQFRVSYLTSDATVDCKNGTNKIDGIRQGSGQGSGQEDVCAVVTAGGDCDVMPANFYVAVNYKGLEFICDSTDFRKGTIGTIHVSKVKESNTDKGTNIVC